MLIKDSFLANLKLKRTKYFEMKRYTAKALNKEPKIIFCFASISKNPNVALSKIFACYGIENDRRCLFRLRVFQKYFTIILNLILRTRIAKTF